MASKKLKFIYGIGTLGATVAAAGVVISCGSKKHASEEQEKNAFEGSFANTSKRIEFKAVTTSINQNEFENETGLTSITLPKVKTIGKDAFIQSPLTSISLPKVTTISETAFQRSQITSLSLPEVTEIGAGAFMQAPITSLKIPKAKSIGLVAFNSIVNASATHVTMSKDFNNDKDKDKIFGIGN